MRKVYAILRLLPMSGLLLIGACGVTSLQFNDFLRTTAVQVVSQGVTNYIGAAILANQG